MKKLFLLCNAHIDPVWQWDLAEGKSVTLSTFASVVDLLENYDFVFCHNESILYQWVEEYSPELFERICKLVKAGKWKIMGGWYIQPDCNMPTAESITRHALVGKKYFAEKFDVNDIETAINLDSFGHSAGLPKLLNSLGYTSYISHRPMECYVHLPSNFIWEGLGGGKLLFAKPTSYNSLLGEARQKIEAEIDFANSENREETLVLWGVGNHGGGPSRKDLRDIETLASERKDIEFVHIWPERYFNEIKDKHLPTVKGDLYPCFPGCYTSQSQIKQLHRQLENMLYETEKLAACAEINGVCEYPEKELEEIQEILLFSQFHDILPGTTVKNVMLECLRVISEGINRLSKIQSKCLFINNISESFVPKEIGELNEEISLKIRECIAENYRTREFYSVPDAKAEDVILYYYGYYKGYYAYSHNELYRGEIPEDDFFLEPEWVEGSNIGNLFFSGKKIYMYIDKGEQL